MDTRILTTNTHIQVERQRIAALEKELTSVASEHGPGTPWRQKREKELAERKARVVRYEKYNAALPQ